MDAPVITPVKDISLPCIRLGKRKGNKQSVYYSVDSTTFDKLRFQTPRMRTPFDIKYIMNKDGKPFIAKVTFSGEPIGSENNKGNVGFFMNKIQKIDNHILNEVKDSSLKFNSSIYKKEPYFPNFSASIPFTFDTAAPKAKFFDKDKKVISIDNLKRGSVCSCVIALDHVWYSGNSYGIGWYVEQVKIYEHHTTIKNESVPILLVDEEDDDD